MKNCIKDYKKRLINQRDKEMKRALDRLHKLKSKPPKKKECDTAHVPPKRKEFTGSPSFSSPKQKERKYIDEDDERTCSDNEQEGVKSSPNGSYTLSGHEKVWQTEIETSEKREVKEGKQDHGQGNRDNIDFSFFGNTAGEFIKQKVSKITETKMVNETVNFVEDMWERTTTDEITGSFTDKVTVTLTEQQHQLISDQAQDLINDSVEFPFGSVMRLKESAPRWLKSLLKETKVDVPKNPTYLGEGQDETMKNFFSAVKDKMVSEKVKDLSTEQLAQLRSIGDELIEKGIKDGTLQRKGTEILRKVGEKAHQKVIEKPVEVVNNVVESGMKVAIKKLGVGVGTRYFIHTLTTGYKTLRGDYAKEMEGKSVLEKGGVFLQKNYETAPEFLRVVGGVGFTSATGVALTAFCPPLGLAGWGVTLAGGVVSGMAWDRTYDKGKELLGY